MGDHFVLLVDRLITASTLEAAMQSRNMSQIQVADEKRSTGLATQWNSSDGDAVSVVPKLVECWIYIPLTLYCRMMLYVHRKCIQRWCNEKGDTTYDAAIQAQLHKS